MRLMRYVMSRSASSESCRTAPSQKGCRRLVPEPAHAAAAYPPTPAMKRFADSIVRQKGINPPPGYKTSIAICRKFLNEHAPKKVEGETAGKHEPRSVSPAQLLYAKKIAQGKGLVIPDVAKANSVAMSAWIDANRDPKRGGGSQDRLQARKINCASVKGTDEEVSETQSRRCGSIGSSQPNSVSGTPLRIPYGNKDVAIKLGARYGSSGWYAPPGVDLSAFGERGWL